MEQKQLDEIDDSYFGEEFVDDESFEEIVVERVNSPLKKDKKMGDKKTRQPRTAQTSGFMDTTEETGVGLIQKNEKTETAALASISQKNSLKKDKPIKMEVKPTDKLESKEMKETKIPVETAPSVNPWANEEKKDNDNGFLKDASTWKAITGIILVLFVFSLFTQGFHFSPAGSAIVAGSLSQQEAESKALSYVNGNLLQPPYVAELQDSAEVGQVYRVTLAVAGQVVDSYITKDGKLFFPQGMDTSISLNKVKEVSPENTPVVNIPADSTVEQTPEVEVAESEQQGQTEAPQVPEAVPRGVQHASVVAKRWLFSPQKLFLQPGKIEFTIEPQDVEFTFAIPTLGVEQLVSGKTMVSLEIKEPGTYDFLCSSCEDWRGMKGSIVVNK